MNADGSRPVAVCISVVAALPSLPWIAGLLAGGILVLAAGVILIAAPARRAPR